MLSLRIGDDEFRVKNQGKINVVLKKVEIKNFKSMKNAKINLKKLNVLIGRNGSGKTNFLEFFKFLKKIYSFHDFPYRPLVDWWSFSNVVYKHDEEKNIEGKFFFEIYLENKIKLNVNYEMIFGLFDGIYQIHYEKIKIQDYIVIVRDGNKITSRSIINLDKYKSDIKAEIKKKLGARRKNRAKELDEMSLINENEFIIMKTKPISILNFDLLRLIFSPDHTLELNILNIKSNYLMLITPYYYRNYRIDDLDAKETETSIFVLKIPQGINPNSFEGQHRYFDIPLYIKSFFTGTLFLRHPNFYEIRKPTLVQGKLELNETSNNLQRILLDLFEKNGGILPESIEYALKELFNGARIGFKRTEDGRNFIVLHENNTVHYPPNISDGLFKILSILVGLETGRSLVLIDEIENSLHYEAIKFLFSEFQDREDLQFIIATHSPVVIDIVDLKDLIITKKEDDATKLLRIKDINKFKQIMREEGLGHSDIWLSGELDK